MGALQGLAGQPRSRFGGIDEDLPFVRAEFFYGVAPGRGVEMPVFDAAAATGRFRLHECGFELVRLAEGLPPLEFPQNRSLVASVIYPMAEKVARQTSGAGIALAFDHRVRHSDGIMQEAPVHTVHSDIVLGRGLTHAQALLEGHVKATDSASRETILLKLLSERVAFVNVWLPLSSAPVVRDPLAVCDWRSRPPDLQDWSGGGVDYVPSHRWHYFSGMSAGDCLVMKQWDSQAVQEVVSSGETREAIDGRDAKGPPPPAREAFHTAFSLPQEGDHPRESVEVRVLLLFGDTLPSSAELAFREAWLKPDAEEYNIFL